MPRLRFDKTIVPGAIEKILGEEAETVSKYIVSFGGGRHRFNYFWHMGAPRIPVQTDEVSALLLNELCGKTLCYLYSDNEL